MAAPPTSPETMAAASPRARVDLHDLGGSVNAAATSFAVSIGGGVLIFAPLGAEWLPYGIVACLIATVAGGTVAAILSSTPVSLSSPRAAACIVLASFVATVSRSVPELPPQAVIALTSLTVVAAGVLQMLASWMGLARLIRFVPFPAVAGFTHGIALSLLIAFLPLFLGVAEVPRIAWPRPEAWHGGALAVAAAGFGAILLCALRSPRLPAIFVGMVAGVAFHAFIAGIVPGIDIGPHVEPGLIPDVQSPFLHWEAVPQLLRDPVGPRLLLSFSVALAAVATIDSMVGTMAVETRYHVRSQPDRDLLAQGLGNAIAGALGGAAIAYSVVSVQSARSAGARGWMVGPLVGAGVAAIAIGFALFVQSVPLAVLAALMVFIAFRLADPWGVKLLKSVVRGGLGRDAMKRESFIVYLLVTLSIVLLDIVSALAVGLVASAVIFTRTMNRQVVRRVTIGASVRSRRRYPPAVMPVLAEAMQEVAVVELEGPLFFGTADRISAAVEKLPASVRYVVLDLRRVQALDASADAVLARTHARLDSQSRSLLLSGGSAGLAAGRTDLPPAFPDRDRAIEWVESRILEDTGLHVEEMAIEAPAVPWLLGMEGEESRVFLGATEIRDLPADAEVFHQGDRGRELFFLLSGRLSICIDAGKGNVIRVATFLPGNMFGEMAFIDGGARTASAVCDVPCRVLALSPAGLERLSAEAPEVVAHLYAALALEISGRLRNTDQMLREEMEA